MRPSLRKRPRNAQTPNRAEWDFRAPEEGGLLDKKEVWECHRYEFSRYSADADKSLLPAWRSEGNQTFDALLEGYLKYDPFGKGGTA